MLAYVTWHRPREGVSPDAYEQSLQRFHRSLAHRPPSGFRRSVSVRVARCPWLTDAQPCYEDWYLLDDWAALGVLEHAAVSRGHLSAHDDVAALAGGEVAAVYRLLEGGDDPGCSGAAVWVTPAPGRPRPALAQLLGDGMDSRRDGLWRRCLVLGPAPQYCLLAAREPAGVAAARVPDGWTAEHIERSVLWQS